ncbi:hypothetical protein OS175_11815 [Marinicella sp. S1101]|uniref:hypothetical protein n=1 Tax=Marinicella marina TaxID=2996016 RepID=UPI00226091A8|nr:hypothetical protein [Marinicella marina]MCX7554569.1 hypothetical protein [Marinicella marina]MDJ1141047.1 hypothetical protein [Marinicella marina]
MKRAETEGTDIKFFAETEGTDINQETVFDKKEQRFLNKSNAILYKHFMLVTLALFISQPIFAADINLFTTDGESFKGVLNTDSKVEFIEGILEGKTGSFILNNTISGIKATDEGTGNKAANNGFVFQATDEGTGTPATDEGTGGLLATDEGTGSPANSIELDNRVLTVNLSCEENSANSNAEIESNKGIEFMDIGKISINGNSVNVCKYLSKL